MLAGTKPPLTRTNMHTGEPAPKGRRRERSWVAALQVETSLAASVALHASSPQHVIALRYSIRVEFFGCFSWCFNVATHGDAL